MHLTPIQSLTPLYSRVPLPVGPMIFTALTATMNCWMQSEFKFMSSHIIRSTLMVGTMVTDGHVTKGEAAFVRSRGKICVSLVPVMSISSDVRARKFRQFPRLHQHQYHAFIPCYKYVRNTMHWQLELSNRREAKPKGWALDGGLRVVFSLGLSRWRSRSEWGSSG